MNPRSLDAGADFQRALPGDGVLFWFISTPAVQINGLAVAQMVAPFPSEDEALRGASLLNERYPGNSCWVGRGEYEPTYATPKRLKRGAQLARADLAGLLAGLEKRA